MKRLRLVFAFYLDASIHVALAVFALVFCTGYTLHILIDGHLAYFLLFGSISCYNFVKYGVEAEKYIRVANRYHKNIQFFSLICVALSMYHAFFLPVTTWLGIGVLVLLTGLYALPVMPGAKNLRNWGGFKIFLVALVWAGTTVVLPVLAIRGELSWDVWIETLQRFLLVLALLVPFEIRDLRYDRPELRTLPQRFGVANTKIFGTLLTVAFFFLTFLKDIVPLQELAGKGLLSLVVCAVIFMTKRNQSKYFASFWVESIPLFWWGMLLVIYKWA